MSTLYNFINLVTVSATAIYNRISEFMKKIFFFNHEIMPYHNHSVLCFTKTAWHNGA